MEEDEILTRYHSAYRFNGRFYISNIRDFAPEKIISVRKICDTSPTTSVMQVYRVKVQLTPFQMGMIFQVIGDVSFNLLMEQYVGAIGISDIVKEEGASNALKFGKVMDRRFTVSYPRDTMETLNMMNNVSPHAFTLGQKIAKGEEGKDIDLALLNLSGEKPLKESDFGTKVLEFILFDQEWIRNRKVVYNRSFHNTTVQDVLEFLLSQSGFRYYMEIPDNQNMYANIVLLNTDIPQSILNIDRDFGIYNSGSVLSFDPDTGTLYLFSRYPYKKRKKEELQTISPNIEDIIDIRIGSTNPAEDNIASIRDSMFVNDNGGRYYRSNRQANLISDSRAIKESFPNNIVTITNRQAVANLMYIQGSADERIAPFNYVSLFDSDPFPNGRIMLVEFDAWNNPYGTFAKAVNIVASSDMIEFSMDGFKTDTITPLTCVSMHHYGKDMQEQMTNVFDTIDSEMMYIRFFEILYKVPSGEEVHFLQSDNPIYIPNVRFTLIRSDSIKEFIDTNFESFIVRNDITDIDKSSFLGLRRLFRRPDNYAAERAAQIGIDTGVTSDVERYSWPSSVGGIDSRRLELLNSDGHTINDKFNSASPGGGYQIGNMAVSSEKYRGPRKTLWLQSDNSLNSLLRGTLASSDTKYKSHLAESGCFIVSILCGVMECLDVKFGLSGDNSTAVTAPEFVQYINDILDINLIDKNCSVNEKEPIVNGFVNYLHSIGRLAQHDYSRFSKCKYNETDKIREIELDSNSDGFCILCLDTIWDGYHFVLGSIGASRVRWDPEGTRLSRGIRGITNSERKYRVFHMRYI